MLPREISVLIVEPDLDIQSLYRQRLIHDPTIRLIGICSSMSSALSMMAQTSVDVLFSELQLPDGDGADLIARACTQFRVENCVVITNKRSQSDVTRAIENGATGYILKGEPGALEIASFVRLVSSGGSPISPSVARMVLTSIQQRKQAATNYRPIKANGLDRNPLSPRESEILNLLAKGMSFAEIGEVLQISSHTVTAHVKKIYRKLQVHSRGEAVYEASQMGLLSTR